MLLWWWAALCCSNPMTLWVVIWSALCFYFAWREEEKSSKKLHIRYSSYSPLVMLKWRLRNVYSAFSASGHLALWLLVPCAVAWSSSCTPPFQSKNNHTEFPLGFYERSNPAEKVCTASFLCHSPGSDPQKFPPKATNAMFSGFAPADLLSNIRPLGSRQELIISQFFRPTKLPAYPGSPTPMSASGAPGWTSPQRQRKPQAQPSFSLFHWYLQH